MVELSRGICLTLPLPPGTNNLYRNVSGVGRVKSSEYKQWLRAAGLGSAPWPRLSDDTRNRIVWEIRLVAYGLSRQRDLDNCFKATIDLICTQTGLRDNYCDHTEGDRLPLGAGEDARVEVTVTIRETGR